MNKLLFAVFVLLISSSLAFSNAISKPDTIFYLVDTAKTPAADRMVEIGVEASYRCYTIQCKCLKYNQKPIFYYDFNKIKGQPLKTLKNIKLITLAKLTNLTREDGGDGFNYNHIAFFIEPEEKHYIQYKVSLLKPVNHAPAY